MAASVVVLNYEKINRWPLHEALRPMTPGRRVDAGKELGRGVKASSARYRAMLSHSSAGKELQTVLDGDGPGFVRGVSCRAARVEHGHFGNHGVEDAAR